LIHFYKRKMSLNFNQTFKCVSCGDDIYSNSLLRVVCVECVPPIDLCLECFSSRAELGQHKAYHSYKLLDNGDFSPLGNDWTAKELVQLLDGLEQFGHGNWNDVSRYVETKGPTDCRDAVNNMFVSGPIGSSTYKESERGNATDHTSPPVLTNSSSSTPSNLSLHELIVLGFMPARDDFEVECENEAEILVSGIQAASGGNRVESDDEELETGLKLAQVDMYKNKLKERERRKQVAKDFGLVETFFKENPLNASTGKISAPKPKKKDPKSEVFEKLKVVSSFQGVEEYKKMVASVSKEKDIKSRIKELLRYRKNGISTLTEAESYESQRLKRNKRKAERKKALESGTISVGNDNNASSSYDQSPIKDEFKKADLDKLSSIVGLPGYELLSVNEKRLCTSLRLHPNLYLSYKTCLLRDHLQKKKGQSPKPVHPSGLDKLHRRKIFNFLLHSGWISAY